MCFCFYHDCIHTYTCKQDCLALTSHHGGSFFSFLLRYGIRFDLFSDDDDLDGIDPITAKKINFLYNKAVVGKEYKEKPPAKGIVLRVQYTMCTTLQDEDIQCIWTSNLAQIVDFEFY